MSLMRKTFCMLIAAVLLGVVTVQAQSASTQVIWVDAVAGDDANDGTIRAVRSLDKALEKAKAIHVQKRHVIVKFKPGTYRGVLYWRSQNDSAVTFEAETPGTATISGADLFTNWQSAGGLLAHAWDKDWSVTPIPKSWELNGLNVDVPDIARRREIVIADGLLLRQVLSRDGLGQIGTFFVDEAANTLTINPGSRPSVIEVGIRPLAMDIQNSANITVRGLTFTGTAQHLDSAGSVINNVQNLVIEENIFKLNGAGGLGISRSNGASRRNQFVNNGSTGLGGAYNRDFVSEQDTACYNNWRGGWGGYYGWSVAGVKMLHQRNIQYRNLTTCHNQAAGLWLDSDIENVTIYRLRSHHNRHDGLYLEALQGPITLHDSVIESNERYGVNISSVHNLEMSGNWIIGNQQAGIWIGGGCPTRSIWNHLTDKDMQLSPAKQMNWTGNYVGGLNYQRGTALWWATCEIEAFQASSVSDRNYWWTADGTRPFLIGNQSRNYYTLAGWRQRTGLDQSSEERAVLMTATVNPSPSPTVTSTATAAPIVPTASATVRPPEVTPTPGDGLTLKRRLVVWWDGDRLVVDEYVVE